MLQLSVVASFLMYELCALIATHVACFWTWGRSNIRTVQIHRAVITERPMSYAYSAICRRVSPSRLHTDLFPHASHIQITHAQSEEGSIMRSIDSSCCTRITYHTARMCSFCILRSIWWRAGITACSLHGTKVPVKTFFMHGVCTKLSMHEFVQKPTTIIQIW